MSRNILVILQHRYRYVACSSDWLVVDTGTVVVDDIAAADAAAVPENIYNQPHLDAAAVLVNKEAAEGAAAVGVVVGLSLGRVADHS